MSDLWTPSSVAFTPKGGCPLKQVLRGWVGEQRQKVAFTPKGGCLLKRKVKVHVYLLVSGSVAFTPKGGCALKLVARCEEVGAGVVVAFTPKGGCPLKHGFCPSLKKLLHAGRSIHPQGWVPIETTSISKCVGS